MWQYENYFFFFQAEDGIRDGRVTGVQTCALPIWIADRPPGRPARVRPTRPREHRRRRRGRAGSRSGRCKIGRASCRKECRSRWSPYHLKKNAKKYKIFIILYTHDVSESTLIKLSR